MESVVCHYVYFKNMGEAAADVIGGIRRQLMAHQDTLKIVDILIGHRVSGKKANDSNFKAALKIDEDFDHYLVVRFREYDDLIDYYSHPVHCDIRKELYRHLNDGLRVLYNLMDRVDLSDEEIVALFEKVIEPVVSRHMMRRDFAEQVNEQYIEG
jgi:hypothetical protein